MPEWSPAYQAAYRAWDAAWRAIVELKKKYPSGVPVELRGTLEADVAAAAERLRRTPKKIQNA